MAEERLRNAVCMGIKNEHPAWLQRWHNKKILMVGDNRVCGLVPLECHMQDLAPQLEYVYYQRASILKILEATYEKLMDSCSQNRKPEIVVIVALHCDFTTFTELSTDPPAEILVPSLPFSQEKKNDVFERIRKLKNTFSDIIFIFTLPYVPHFYDYNVSLTRNIPESQGLIDPQEMIEHGKQYKLLIDDFLKSWEDERLGIIEDMEVMFNSFSSCLPLEDNTYDGLQPTPTMTFRFWMSILAIARKLSDCEEYFHTQIRHNFPDARNETGFSGDASGRRQFEQENFSDDLSNVELDFFEDKQLKNMREAHNEKCDMYLRIPEMHPHYEEQRRWWFQERSNSQDANNPNLEAMWEAEWRKEMQATFDEKWNILHRQFLSQVQERNRASPSNANAGAKQINNRKRRRIKYSEGGPSNAFSNYGLSEERDSSSPQSIEILEGEERPFQSFNENGQHQRYEPTFNSEGLRKGSDLNNGSFSTRNVSFSKGKNDEFNVLSLTTVLFHISERFGALAMAVVELHAQVTRAVKRGNDPITCIDDDAEILLDLVADKMANTLEGERLNLVQRGIIQEAYNRLKTFKNLINKDANFYTQLDLESIAKFTVGQHASEIIACIENALKEKNFYDISKKKLMETYMKVKAIQFNMESESAEKNHVK